MDQYRVKRASLKGEIVIPASKSHTLRAILFASMAKGKSTIHRYLASTDTFAMINACRLFGATIDVHSEYLDILGIGGIIRHAENVIDAGNSGIVLRFCSAIGALSSLPIVVTGDHSIRHQRPIKELLSGLSQLGAKTSTMRGDNHAPVIIQGPISGNYALISGEDSQPVSALLIAAAFAKHPIEINVENPGEKPWVAMTLNWFGRLGIRYENDGYERYRLFGCNSYEGFTYNVPGDFSSAAFPIAAALVTGSELKISNLDMNDAQGDKQLISVFQKMGAHIDVDAHSNSLTVKTSGVLKGISVDINDFVDAIAVLAVVACFAEGETQIRNAAIVKQKESNRIDSIAKELNKMGANIHPLDDGLIIKKSSLTGTTLDSHHDHRIAMSLTVASLAACGESVITPINCVAKTFPSFLNDFNALGANIKASS